MRFFIDTAKSLLVLIEILVKIRKVQIRDTWDNSKFNYDNRNLNDQNLFYLHFLLVCATRTLFSVVWYYKGKYMIFIRLTFEQSVLKLESISRPILRISKFASNQAEFQIVSRFRLFYSRLNEAKRRGEIFCTWILLIRQLFSFGGSSFRKNVRGTWVENINDGCRV